MKIGFIGLGKMGLPLAVSMALKGHDVMGYDCNPDRMTHSPQPYREAGPSGDGDFNNWLAESKVRFGSIKKVVDHGDIVFVAVQTPHYPRYEGITEMPGERKDFNYLYLAEALSEVEVCVEKPTTVVVMSTVLPGTIARVILPITNANKNISLVYNPSFIAMGTTMRDYLDPEFVLVGSMPGNHDAVNAMREYYATICDAPVRAMSIESAELAKVAYNTYISLKIGFTNIVMEICDRFPTADVDDVMNALKSAHRRLISPAYMSGGMGDGGGCHPRDNIAMSWLARTQGLSYDIFEATMLARQENARWLAEMLVECHRLWSCAVVILGVAFKPETDLDIGSPARLVAEILRSYGCDPILVDDRLGTSPTEAETLSQRAVFLIGCKHDRYRDMKFPKSSIVIDPHRYIPDAPDGSYTVRRLGEGIRE